jgi:putative transposase
MGAPSRSTVQSETYATDLTDEPWALFRSTVEVDAKRRPTRQVALRAVLNALLSKLKTGCQRQVLPRAFPPKSTVHSSFQK